jgi:hypothetical protein
MCNFRKIIMKRPIKFVIIGMVILTCLLSSCCRRGQNELQEIYVISSLAKSGNSHFIIPLNYSHEKEYYQQFNFLIDSSGIIYYYSFQPGEWGFITSPIGPVFANIKKEQIIQVPPNSIIEFLKCNVLGESKYIKISIASQRDTIKSAEFIKLYNYLSDSTKVLNFNVRQTTIEENIVMNFKKRHFTYYPSFIKWDSTKTIFIKPTIEVKAKFVPPIVVKNE